MFGGLPEARNLVDACDHWLAENRSAVRDAVAAFTEHCSAQDISVISGLGWPLRPLFLDRQRMNDFAVSFSRTIREFAARLGASRKIATAEGALPSSWLELIDIEDTFSAPHLTYLAKPDGFLREDTFEISELNTGNGTLLSATYTETLFDFYDRWLRWPQHLEHLRPHVGSKDRPFLALAQTFKKLGRRPNPHVALLTPTSDLRGAELWGQRVHQQFGWAPRLLAEQGITTESVNEEDLFVDRDGACICPSGKQAHVVFGVTSCIGLLESGSRLHSDLKQFRGGWFGNAPFLAPAGALILEKGCLPALGRFLEPRREKGWRIVPSEFAHTDAAVKYRWNKDSFVLKRAYEDKHTIVGKGVHGRAWNRLVDAALDTRRYIIQQFRELPKTTLPVLIQGEIEWLEVVVEVSPFIYGHDLAGVMARYAPPRDGVILSPPPEDMGFGVAYLV